MCAMKDIYWWVLPREPVFQQDSTQSFPLSADVRIANNQNISKVKTFFLQIWNVECQQIFPMDV